MPPKKADDKKDKKDDGPDPKVEIGKFKKEYAAQSAALQVEELPLHMGDGSEVFRKMILHPQLLAKKADDAANNPCLLPLHTKALAGALAAYAHLQTLCLWSANVQDEGAAALGVYIAANRTLVSLELPDCSIGALGCKALADGLERNMSVLKLTLDYNPIGSAGVEALGGLRFNRCLQSLDLCYCGLTPQDGALLADGPMRCAPLKNLELKGNLLEADGVLAVLGAVKAGGRVFHLGLGDTGFGRDPAVHALLLDVCTSVQTCCEYDLMGNSLGDAFAYELLKLARAHGHLIDIRICATCAVDNLLYKQLMDVCAANKKEWIKANKKKGGKKGGKGKKKK